MKVPSIVTKGVKWTEGHQRQIALVGIIVGTGLTAVLSWKAGIKADAIIKEQKEKIEGNEKDMIDSGLEEDDSQIVEMRREVTIETIKRMAPVVIPPALAAGATIASSIWGYNVASKQIATISALYSICESTLTTQNDKIKEIVGPKKAQEIKDAVNEDKLKKAEVAPTNSNIISTGSGYNVPCYDVHSGRYFYSSAERIRQACNTINKRLMDEMYISLNELYDELGLPSITLGEEIGFTIDNDLIDIDHLFTAVPMEINGATVPVLVFDVDHYLTAKFMEHRGRFF